MRPRWAAKEAPDQCRRPRYARQLRIVIQIERGRLLRARGKYGRHIGGKAIIRHALVIERRQHQRAAEAEFRGVAGQRDGVGGCSGAGPDHHAVERQAGGLVGVHHGLALRNAVGGRFASGAKHVEAIAAMVEEEAGKRNRARRVRCTGAVGRGRDSGNDFRKPCHVDLPGCQVKGRQVKGCQVKLNSERSANRIIR